ncbi:MAG: hypothetical protein GF355_17815, partial [Candidatus Eisenbacteria bacterium]|nr:hypothetical protein [Candidatus Eisenbacteria bacterium]
MKMDPLPRALAALGFLLLGLLPGAAQDVRIYSGHFLIVDRAADPQHTGTAPGAIYSIYRDNPGVVRIAATPPEFVDPTSVFIGHNKSVYVSDAAADPLGLGQENGAVFRVDPHRRHWESAQLMAASPRFREPLDVAVDAAGRVIVLDQRADPIGYRAPVGAIFRIDPATQREEILASSEEFRNLVRLLLEDDGGLLVLDSRADPLGLGGSPGAIFRLDPESLERTVFFSRDGFRSLTSLRRAPGGDYILVDEDIDPFGLGTAPGGVIRLDGTTRTLTDTLASHADFRDPIDAILTEENRLFVLDRTANPLDFDNSQGAVFEIDPDTGDLVGTWARDDLAMSWSLLPVHGADLDSSTVSVTDLNGPPVRRGDILQTRVLLRNTGDEDAGLVTLVDSLGAGLALVAGSEAADDGVFDYLEEIDAPRWRGEIPAGTTVGINFDLLVGHEAPQRVEQRFGVWSPELATAFTWLFGISNSLPPGTVLVSDPTGLYRLQEGTSSVEALEGTEGLILPGAMFFMPDGRLLVADPQANAVPGEPGAIYVMQPPGGLPAVLTAGLPIIAPAGMDMGREEIVYVADIGRVAHDPFPDEPGAVYFLDGETQQPVEFFAGDPIVHPSDLWLDDRGGLYVVDFGADPGGAGGEPGALFHLSLATGEILAAYTHPDFVDPRGVTPLGGGRLVITDRSADPLALGEDTGALFLFDAGAETIELLLADSRLVDPIDAVRDTLGDLLIADRDGNPGGGPENRGAVWRYDLETGELTTAVSNATVRDPAGIVLFGQGDFRESWQESEDLNGGHFFAGDTISTETHLLNYGNTNLSNAQATVVVSEGQQLLSATATSGTVGVLEGTQWARWTGPLARGDSVTIVTRSLVPSAQGFTFWEPFQVSLDVPGPTAPAGSSAVFRLIAPLQQQDLVAVDREADPLGFGGNTGSLFLLGEEPGEGRILYSDSALVDPVSAVRDRSGDIVILDRRANPGGFDHDTGAVFRLDVS